MIPLTETPQAGQYGVIYADPPWHYRAYNAAGEQRGPARHYPVMKLPEICALPVRKVAARDCHLFLWTYGPHLRQAFEVMDAWGFKYSSVAFTWVKLRRRAPDLMFITEADFHLGPGHTTRKNAEICLLGRRGSPKRRSGGVRELIVSARREHSRKPDQARARIEQYAEGPFLEMFSRTSAPGWDSWGNEVGKFAEYDVA